MSHTDWADGNLILDGLRQEGLLQSMIDGVIAAETRPTVQARLMRESVHHPGTLRRAVLHANAARLMLMALEAFP